MKLTLTIPDESDLAWEWQVLRDAVQPDIPDKDILIWALRDYLDKQKPVQNYRIKKAKREVEAAQQKLAELEAKL